MHQSPKSQTLTQPCKPCKPLSRFDLHVLLVTHGKVCPTCKKGGGGGGKPAGAPCPLAAIIRQGRATHSATPPLEEAEEEGPNSSLLSDAVDAVSGSEMAMGKGKKNKPVAARSRAGSGSGVGGGNDGGQAVKRQKKAGKGEAVAAVAVAAVAEAAGDALGVKAELAEGELLPLGQVGFVAFLCLKGCQKPAVTQGC